MSSPSSQARIVIDDQPPSPRAVRVEEPYSPPRSSPTVPRSFHPDDPDVRERQRTMDVDLAIQMSRARSASVAMSRPSFSYNTALSPTVPPRGSSDQDRIFPMLSHHEEEQMTLARGDETEGDYRPNAEMDPSLILNAGHDPHLLVSHDPNLLVSHDPHLLASHEDSRSQVGSSTLAGGLQMYIPSIRSHFDFGPMEVFAREEKAVLDISSNDMGRSPNAELRWRLAQAGIPAAARDSTVVEEIKGVAGDNAAIPMRQRKLSQSTPQPRRQGGKLAMFESPGGGPVFPLPAMYDLNSRTGPSIGIPIHSQSGHDKPYRFSFYSNALSATIHARSLSELPHDGQSFEDLFLAVRKDTNPVQSKSPEVATSTQADVGIGPRSKSKENLTTKMPHGNGRGHNAGKHDDPILDDEANTWWLDVLSPTDEEMRMLSKVFSIHPLTTEDIQMEEAREKIELFRNYYLVCFRSFDQDRYSPTYLEPLNYYIIVFREGTLSFHFRASPHPQNVRRRITQLKDYISVTSDWISYALIDDITDAFGPLIQNIEYEVDSIDELVLILKNADQSDMLRRIGTCRKKVMGLLRLMGNKADVVKGLAKRCNENWIVAPKSDIGLYLSDIQDHLITMTQNLNHYEKILSRSHSNYLAQISIEMSESSNQINKILSRLTALGTILVPMNLITGLWGMNVHVPGQDDQTTYTWFIGIICALIAIAVAGTVLAYRLFRVSRRT